MKIVRREQQEASVTDGRGFELALVADPDLGEVPEWFHFGFPLMSQGQLERVYAELTGAEMARSLRQEESGFASFQVKDPDGYLIEFYFDPESR